MSIPAVALTDTDAVLHLLEAGGTLGDITSGAVPATIRPVTELLAGSGLGPVEYDQTGQPRGDVLRRSSASAEDPQISGETVSLACRYCGDDVDRVIEYAGEVYDVESLIVAPSSHSGPAELVAKYTDWPDWGTVRVPGHAASVTVLGLTTSPGHEPLCRRSTPTPSTTPEALHRRARVKPSSRKP